MKAARKSIEVLKPVVRGWVEEALYDLLGDPDEGLELREWVRTRLKNSVVRGRKGKTAKQVAKKLGLSW